METLLGAGGARALEAVLPILEIGLYHEQQHQELLITDILHAFAQNPLASGLRSRRGGFRRRSSEPGTVELAHGIAWIGQTGHGFSFDNESPRHEA